MAKKSLIYLFIIALAYVCVQVFLRPYLAASPFIIQTISILYLWSPGILALIFAYKEKLKLPVFAKPTRAFWMIPVATLLIALFGFLCAIPFGATEALNQVLQEQTFLKKVGYVALFLCTSYFFLGLLFAFVFLGGELYWRGYLLEKFKEIGVLKAIWLIALFWSLWQIPVTMLTYAPQAQSTFFNIAFTFVLNFALAPVLTFFRIKGQSILTSAFFYSFMMSAYMFYLILFPVVHMRVVAIYGGFSILGLVLFSLLFKLYSPKTWQKSLV